tara:strand:+ start:352 stop:537 length:186 start_codon:yes stop_codon:yes gene_type:complete
MGKKLLHYKVLERFKKVHGDRYNYSLVEYVNSKTKIIIICNKGGHRVFLQALVLAVSRRKY